MVESTGCYIFDDADNKRCFYLMATRTVFVSSCGSGIRLTFRRGNSRVGTSSGIGTGMAETGPTLAVLPASAPDGLELVPAPQAALGLGPPRPGEPGLAWVQAQARSESSPPGNLAAGLLAESHLTTTRRQLDDE